MISVTRLNGKLFYVNCDLIEFMEETPDTIITMTTGKKVVVKESVSDLINSIQEFKRGIFYKYIE